MVPPLCPYFIAIIPGTRNNRVAFTLFGVGVGVGIAYKTASYEFEKEKKESA